MNRADTWITEENFCETTQRPLKQNNTTQNKTKTKETSSPVGDQPRKHRGQRKETVKDRVSKNQLWRTAQGWMILGKKSKESGTNFQAWNLKKWNHKPKTHAGKQCETDWAMVCREMGAHDCPQKWGDRFGCKWRSLWSISEMDSSGMRLALGRLRCCRFEGQVHDIKFDRASRHKRWGHRLFCFPNWN